MSILKKCRKGHDGKISDNYCTKCGAQFSIDLLEVELGGLTLKPMKDVVKTHSVPHKVDGIWAIGSDKIIYKSSESYYSVDFSQMPILANKIDWATYLSASDGRLEAVCTPFHLYLSNSTHLTQLSTVLFGNRKLQEKYATDNDPAFEQMFVKTLGFSKGKMTVSQTDNALYYVSRSKVTSILDNSLVVELKHLAESDCFEKIQELYIAAKGNRIEIGSVTNPDLARMITHRTVIKKIVVIEEYVLILDNDGVCKLKIDLIRAKLNSESDPLSFAATTTQSPILDLLPYGANYCEVTASEMRFIDPYTSGKAHGLPTISGRFSAGQCWILGSNLVTIEDLPDSRSQIVQYDLGVVGIGNRVSNVYQIVGNPIVEISCANLFYNQFIYSCKDSLGKYYVALAEM